MQAAKTWFLVAFAVMVFTLGAYAKTEVSPAAAPAQQAAAGHGEHHGLTPDAVVLFHVGPLVVTNSMVMLWSVGALLIAFGRIATRKMEWVPSGAQNLFEWLVESLYNFIEGVLGAVLGRKTFWFFGTVFIVILFENWAGLLPGVGSIRWGSEPLLRGGNADLNMTAAMALLFMVLWCVWALQANGLWGTIKHIFWPGGDNRGIMGAFIVVIFILVGVLELVSIAFRPVSLSLRLYGNVFAGENILESMLTLSTWLGWAIALPFYLLELLVGLVQALVFTLLSAVFTVLICEHQDDGSHDKEGHASKEGHGAH
jgi:F-type H+-transporting ATPase subunit a